MFCTYLTIYKGNKMPMFYIGRTTVNNIQNGYCGSVSSKLYKDIWKFEVKNNLHLFKTIILTLHKTKKESAEKEEYFHKFFNVHKNIMYINQATGYGSFFTDISGNKNPWFGKGRSGANNPMFGKRHTTESRNKMSKSAIGKHSQPKTQEFKDYISSIQSGKSFEDRFGPEKARVIKDKMRKPRSKETCALIKEKALIRAQQEYVCPHCGKTVRLLTNFIRWHNDNCKLRPII